MFGTLPPLALLMAVLTTTVAVWGIPFRLAGEMTGANQWRLWRPGGIRSLFSGVWSRFDGWMRSSSQLPANGHERNARWQVRIRYFLRTWRRRLRPSSLRGRHVRAWFLAGLLLMLVAVGLLT